METRRDGTPTDQPQQRVISSTISPSASAPTNESFQVTPPSISLPKGGGAGAKKVASSWGILGYIGLNRWLIPVDDGSGGHQGIDRGAQGFDDGLDEQLVLAVEVSVDDALADPGALGDDPDRGAGGVAVLDERPARRIEDRGLPGCGGQPSPDRWVAVLRCRRAHGQDSNHRSGGQGTLTHLARGRGKP